MAALSDSYLQPAMTKVDIALTQLRVKESEIALWKPVQASHATKPRAQQVAAEAKISGARKKLKAFTMDLAQF